MNWRTISYKKHKTAAKKSQPMSSSSAIFMMCCIIYSLSRYNCAELAHPSQKQPVIHCEGTDVLQHLNVVQWSVHFYKVSNLRLLYKLNKSQIAAAPSMYPRPLLACVSQAKVLHATRKISLSRFHR